MGASAPVSLTRTIQCFSYDAILPLRTIGSFTGRLKVVQFWYSSLRVSVSIFSMTASIIIFVATKLYLFIVAAAAIFFFFLDRSPRKRMFILSLFTLPLAYLTGKLLNHLIFDPRPFVVNPSLTPLFYHAADNGFPSDHTLLTATIASIVFVYNKPFGALLMLLSISVGVARVLAHVHHYLDIAGSVVIGIAATYVVVQIIRYREQKTKKVETAPAE